MQSSLSRLPIGIALAFLVAFVGLPLAALLWESVDTPSGFGFSAWSSMLSDPIDRAQLGYSVALALASTAVATLLGFGFAWLTFRTDLPGARMLAPLGIAPLAVPPILVAMGFADLFDAAGFLPCALLLGVSYSPFVAVLTARGLRSVDGRAYEAAWLARGRGAAERMLLRLVAAEIAAGALLAFIFAISEHGVPEFLTVKGKTWHTYAEGIFANWKRRATGVSHEDITAPIVSAVPLVLIVTIALVLALRLRAHSNLRSDTRPLPRRELGAWRFPALLWPMLYLGAGLGVPVVVMGLWAAGSTDLTQPMSLEVLRSSFRVAFTEAQDNMLFTLGVAIATAWVLVVVAVPLARLAARRAGAIDHICVVPLAVPAILLGIGFVRVFNSPMAVEVYDTTGDFYDSPAIVVAAYATRFLPFGVLTLSSFVRRVPPSVEDAAVLTGRGRVARALRIHGPMMLPAAWSAASLVFVLALRELDLAVVLPAGNQAVVRRLSNVVHFGGEDMGGALALTLLATAILLPVLSILVTGRKLRPLS